MIIIYLRRGVPTSSGLYHSLPLSGPGQSCNDHKVIRSLIPNPILVSLCRHMLARHGPITPTHTMFFSLRKMVDQDWNVPCARKHFQAFQPCLGVVRLSQASRYQFAHSEVSN
jgi:hypothetical protein